MFQPMTATFTQSKFYTPTLNAAIFDGPLRLYFAQSQEPEALQIYFQLQKLFEESVHSFKEKIKDSGQNIFVLLYPAREVFEQVFTGDLASNGLIVDHLGHDFILGVQGPVGELEFVRIQEGLFRIFNSQQASEPSFYHTL
ncbi:MAG: hypothetical protein KDD34_02420 [Bdellovibrionales bacterium]|nr:hypothetical protein [Bdellovibrionales bacterium]